MENSFDPIVARDDDSRSVSSSSDDMCFVVRRHMMLNENGAQAYTLEGAGDPRVVLFFKLVRDAKSHLDEPIANVFRAARDNPEMFTDLVVLAFQTRDVRGGKGERELFYRLAAELAARNVPPAVWRLIPEYGSWLDVRVLIARFQNCYPAADPHQAVADILIDMFVEQLRAESGLTERPPSYCAKWAPREHSKKFSRIAKQIAARLFVGEYDAMRKYRELVADLNRRLGTVEIPMCAHKWATIEPSKVPSVCMRKRELPFLNVKLNPTKTGYVQRSASPDRVQCAARFEGAILSKESTLHGDTLMPHEIVAPYLTTFTIPPTVVPRLPTLMAKDEKLWADKLEKVRALGSLGRMLALCDFSGSMRGVPMQVSVALGILVSQCAHEAFRDRVITFSDDPMFVDHGSCATLADKVGALLKSPWGYSTNFEAVYTLILNAATMARIPPQDMPTKLLVISDMQFNAASAGAGFNPLDTTSQIARAFAERGYAMPTIVYWNVRGDTDSMVATSDTPGVEMLAGFSENLLKHVVEGAELPATEIPAAQVTETPDPKPKTNPYIVLRRVLDDERYNAVRAALNTAASMSATASV